MKPRLKFLGHAIHPVLIVFPLGLLITSLVFDIIYAASDNTIFALVSYYMIAAGILGGLLAAIFGAIDWLAIPSGTRAKAVGLWHGIGNVGVIALFVISWLLRRDVPERPETFAIVLSFLGVGLGAVTGWLGGELVERLGVAVDDGANLNAPSSLSGRPTTGGIPRSPRSPGVTT
jgi:uncharacterized membrane protein